MAFTALLASIYVFGGVRSSSYSAVAIPIILGGVLLGGSAPFVLAVLGIGQGGMLMQAGPGQRATFCFTLPMPA
jgi:hypothetical protein